MSSRIDTEAELLFKKGSSITTEAPFKEVFDLICYKSEVIEPRASALLLEYKPGASQQPHFPGFIEVCGANTVDKNSMTLDEVLNFHPDRVVLIVRDLELEEAKKSVTDFLKSDPILEESLKKSLRIYSLMANRDHVLAARELLESLAEIIYPHEFEYGHEKKLWSH